MVTVDQDSRKEIPGFLAMYKDTQKNIVQLGRNLDAGSVEDEDEFAELEFMVGSVKDHGKNIEKNDFLAWDYVRAIHILGWGYLAEYLAEDEAYDMMKPFAKKLQEQFDSWDEMSENYLLGRGYWNYEETDHDMLEEDRQKLLKDAGSPWVQIGFKSVKF